MDLATNLKEDQVSYDTVKLSVDEEEVDDNEDDVVSDNEDTDKTQTTYVYLNCLPMDLTV